MSDEEETLDRAIGEAVRRGGEGEEMILTWVVGVAYRTPQDYADGTTRYGYWSPTADGSHTIIGLTTIMLDYYRRRD